MPSADIEFQAVPSIGDIPAEAWDACANPAFSGAITDSHCTVRERYNPFIAHAFYHALEASRSACPRTGWAPQHLIAKRGGQIVGVVPCYAKSHSRGEYVFDAGWADAYERAGGRYYPKLQVSVPFTPATGPRLRRAGGPRPACQGADGAVPDYRGLVGPRHLRAPR
jgi:predicted N-acyltransferase